MLDNLTKQHIDNLCDILVGVVPDPKSQADQIKTALIYKFMDDMDKRSISIGGKASFFSGEYEKYAWSNLMATSLGGIARRDLYMEGLIKMQNNTSLPVLFHRIFEDASLPFTNSETLSLFLKEIDLINYDDSESLGDAFEYLLAKMGAQGKAGMFRTPRHIIDFIVKAVDPAKNDRILDPACGTGGFLISAYNHILSKHIGDDNLSGAENKRLTENIHGYDISPEMVRFSLVNMYLHDFSNPQVHEYDTLTNDARWEDKFDVILANPPFMTPRGGIRPHNRFAVRANRAEVLFVDYIMEHLSPEGKAGIIVPEGIIFQSSNAYKQLRRMLVEEDYLYAVVSLPAGVFNPYAGVKTSILLLDRKFAKQSDSILFVEVQHDGFDLGAQRNPIQKNDLPKALDSIQDFKASPDGVLFETKNILIIKKEKISEDVDFNLSINRYQSVIDLGEIKWEIFNLKDIAEVISGQSPSSDFYNEIGEGLPFYQGKTDFTDKFLGEPQKWTTEITKIALPDDILMSVRAPVGPVNMTNKQICIGRGLAAIRVDKTKALPTFVFYILKYKQEIIQGNHGTTFASINRKQIENISIPVPPIEMQQDIVAEIEGYQKVITGARQVVENYRPHIPIDPAWPLVELGEVCETEYGHNESAKNEGDTRFIRITDIDQNGLLRNDDVKYITLTDESKPYLLKKGDVVIARTGATYGKTFFFNEEIQAVFAGYLIRLIFDKEKIVNKYFWCFAQGGNYDSQKKLLVTGGGQPQFNANAIKKIRIPLPCISTQNDIVGRIEEELQIVESNRTLIRKFGKKIEERVARVWGK